jgi:exosortase
LFPLGFLVFMIPIPAVVLEATTQVLKRGSTEVVAALFALTGTPNLRRGFVFSLPTVVIRVADECSGIRSSIALLLMALLMGHTSLTSGWSKTCLALATLPITILKNGIRIVTLTLLAVHVNPGFLTGRLHNQGGIVFFLIGVAALVPLAALLARLERTLRRPVDGHTVSHDARRCCRSSEHSRSTR